MKPRRIGGGENTGPAATVVPTWVTPGKLLFTTAAAPNSLNCRCFLTGIVLYSSVAQLMLLLLLLLYYT
jgi:hypothetical protein